MDRVLEPLTSSLRFTLHLIFDRHGWVVIIAVLGLLVWHATRKQQRAEKTKFAVLRLIIPDEHHYAAEAAVNFIASLHELLRSRAELLKSGAIAEHISLEIAARRGIVAFYIRTPEHLQHYIEAEIRSAYPEIIVTKLARDYVDYQFGKQIVVGSEVDISGPSSGGLRQDEGKDPLLGIMNALADCAEGEQAWLQLLVRPVNSRSKKERRHLVPFWLRFTMDALQSRLPTQLLDMRQQQLTPQQTINDNKMFETKLRVIVLNSDDDKSRPYFRLEAIANAFKLLSGSKKLAVSRQIHGVEAMRRYKARFMFGRAGRLRARELGLLFHLPQSDYRHAGFVWSEGPALLPPLELPLQSADPKLTPLGSILEGSDVKQFGIKTEDRLSHLLVSGEGGSGKSSLLLGSAIADLHQGRGVMVLDPQGSLVTELLRFIPSERLEDVVYINPTDTDYPVVLNPLHGLSYHGKYALAATLASSLRSAYPHLWRSHMEHVLHYAILGLSEMPHSSLPQLLDLLTIDTFRINLLSFVEDDLVREFLARELPRYQELSQEDVIQPLLLMLKETIKSPYLAGLLSGERPSFYPAAAINRQKIVLVDLSSPKIGKPAARVLGTLLGFELLEAARTINQPFYTYIDDVEEAISPDLLQTLLGEAHRVNLSLSLASGKLGSIPPAVRNALFTTIGSFISFHPSPEDAELLSSLFKPLSTLELRRLTPQRFLARLRIDAQLSEPFVGSALSVPEGKQELVPQVLAASRARYGRKRPPAPRRRPVLRFLPPSPTPVATPVNDNTATPELTSQWQENEAIQLRKP